ncbi:hypothetical protein ACVWZZ_006680 [Bradyrhizobium sp. LM6.10]
MQALVTIACDTWLPAPLSPTTTSHSELDPRKWPISKMLWSRPSQEALWIVCALTAAISNGSAVITSTRRQPLRSDSASTAVASANFICSRHFQRCDVDAAEENETRSRQLWLNVQLILYGKGKVDALLTCDQRDRGRRFCADSMGAGRAEISLHVIQRQDDGGIQTADGWPWGLGEHGGSCPSGVGPAIRVLHGSVRGKL